MSDAPRGAHEHNSGFSAHRIVVAAVVAALGLLPVSDWLGITFQRALSFQAVDWRSGSVLVALLTTVFLIAVWRDDRAQFVARPLHALIAVWERRPVLCTLLIAMLATFVYAIVAWRVFDAKPLLIDEIVQVVQARVFASGRMWLPVDAYPEFRSMTHVVEQGGRWYGQFPPGGPAMLALGELVRAPWIVNPVFGGISAAAFATALRWSGTRAGVSLGATLAFAFAPFVVFQSASHMNHVTSLAWLLVATAALVRATNSDAERPLASCMCGLGLGIAATIRPLDAAAWALPAAAWFGARAVQRRHWRALISSGAGVALPMAVMMLVNTQMTGSPLTFGYTVLWGQAHGLGFHDSPWGESHTIARGIALIAAYLNRLNDYLFEVPFPSLVPALACLVLARRSSPLERYLFASAALLIGAYFAYWHDGFYLGPRFVVPLAPLAALLVARLPSVVAERWRSPIAVRGVGSAYAAAALLGVTMVLPWRAQSYHAGFQSMRWDYDRIVSDAGARGDVVLIRTSWGAQVIARLWALGVSRSFTEFAYRRIDTCGLEYMARQLEREGVRGADAEARIRPMLADSSRVVSSTMSSDATERVLPGSVYTPECVQRIAEDQGGYTHYEPSRLARDTSTVWLRDLHARDTVVVALEQGRRVWLLRRAAGTDAVTPVLVRIDGDSLRAAWGRAR